MEFLSSEFDVENNTFPGGLYFTPIARCLLPWIHLQSQRWLVISSSLTGVMETPSGLQARLPWTL